MNKKIFFATVFSMGAVAFTACQNEESENLAERTGFSVVAGIGNGSRTALDTNNQNVYWSEGDQIYLFGGTSNATMDLVEGVGETQATFRGGINGMIQELTTALYPVPTVNGDVYTFELPSERTWSENSAAPMVGAVQNGSVAFTNLTALVRVPLCNLDENKEYKVELTMSNVIAGSATVTVGEEPSFTMNENGTRTVTVTVPAGNTECNVDFPVPAGTYSGYKLEVNGTVWAEMETEKELTKDDVLILKMKSTAVEPESNTYSIATVTDLLWFAEQVNGGETFKGKTVQLSADIDLDGIEWTPIGDCESSKYFQGTFDGQNYTISNLYVDNSADASEHSTSGLFGWVDAAGATIKSVKVDGATVKGSHWTGVIVGYMTGTVSGCEVTNSTVVGVKVNDDADGDEVGGIVGHLNEHSYLNGNKVSNSTITGNRDIGGIAGAVAESTYEMNGNEMTDVVLTFSTIRDYASAGKIVSGRTGYTANETNVATNVTIKYAGEVADNDVLEDVIEAGTTEIELSEGTFIIPDVAKGKTLTFIGTSNDASLTTMEVQDDGSYEGCDYSLDGSTVTFENVAINTPSTTHIGYARLNATYKRCIINGTYTLYGNSVFEDCEFNVTGDVYNIWTWGAPTAKFINCTFNSDGKAMLLYGTADTQLTVEGCVFNDKGGLSDLKAAIEIGDDYNKSYELIVNNTTVNGYEINDKGINTGTALWANKNSMGTDKLNVVVDGVDVY